MGKLYKKIENFLPNDTGDILEIGMDRGEDSTKYFIELANKRNVTYVGVDMDPRQTYKHLNTPNTEIHNTTGEAYLKIANKMFSIVYLDNFDWNYWKDNNSGPIPRQQKSYTKYMNIELNNVNSQAAHLNQVIALMDKLTPNAVIMCDDTWWVEADMVYMGKCSSAIPYLLSKGFIIAHTEGFRNNPQSCVILTRQVDE